MSDELRQENERLRSEIEAMRQRELEQLRSALAQMTAERDHMRGEVNRNAEAGRQLHSEMQGEINRLRAENESLRRDHANRSAR